MGNKHRVKSLLERKLEDPEYRKRHEESYAAFKLEVQILQALEKKDWSYADLAKATNTYKSNISRDLKAGGIFAASFSRISKIAKALGMRLIALLIPDDQADSILPRIEALVRVSYDVCGEYAEFGQSRSANEASMQDPGPKTEIQGPHISTPMPVVQLPTSWGVQP